MKTENSISKSLFKHMLNEESPNSIKMWMSYVTIVGKLSIKYKTKSGRFRNKYKPIIADVFISLPPTNNTEIQSNKIVLFFERNDENENISDFNIISNFCGITYDQLIYIPNDITEFAINSILSSIFSCGYLSLDQCMKFNLEYKNPDRNIYYNYREI